MDDNTPILESDDAFALAFIDVLGWKALTAGQHENVIADLKAKVASAAGGVFFPAGPPSLTSGHALTMNCFTDAIVVQFSVMGSMFNFGSDSFWDCINYTCLTLLSHGLIVRGAVTVGWRSQFNAVLKSASEQEKAAKNPMIVVHTVDGTPNPLLTTGFEISGRVGDGQGVFRRLPDGRWIFDFFRYVAPMLSGPERKREIRAKLEMFRDAVVANLEKYSVDKNVDRSVVEKYRWFGEFMFNEVAKEVGAPLVKISKLAPEAPKAVPFNVFNRKA